MNNGHTMDSSKPMLNSSDACRLRVLFLFLKNVHWRIIWCQLRPTHSETGWSLGESSATSVSHWLFSIWTRRRTSWSFSFLSFNSWSTCSCSCWFFFNSSSLARLRILDWKCQQTTLNSSATATAHNISRFRIVKQVTIFYTLSVSIRVPRAGP